MVARSIRTETRGAVAVRRRAPQRMQWRAPAAGSLRRPRIERIDEYSADGTISANHRRAIAFSKPLRAPDHSEPCSPRLPRRAGGAGYAWAAVAPAVMDEQRCAPAAPAEPIARPPTKPHPRRNWAAELRGSEGVRLVLNTKKWPLPAEWDEAGARSQARQTRPRGFQRLQTLVTLALRSRRKGGLRREDPLHRLLRGFRVELATGEATDASVDQANPYLQSPRFVLRRTGTHASMKAPRPKDRTA